MEGGGSSSPTLVALLALFVAVLPSHGQALHPSRLAPATPRSLLTPTTAARTVGGASSFASERSLRPPSAAAREVGPWWAPIASAVLPGSGQALQRRGRAVPYLAAETYLLAQYLAARDEGRQRRSQFRSLARVARMPYSTSFPSGGFEYYESMEHFVESGVFDLNPGGDLEPETDTATFNGASWRLARQTFWENPDVPPPRESEAFRSAVDFYQRRAVRPEFRWSWRNAQLEQDLFRRTVQGSNNAFRLSSQYLAVLIANHALSAVDAFVRLRLTRRLNSEQRWGVGGTVDWAPLGRPDSHDRARRPP
jgi:hypothetical protein